MCGSSLTRHEAPSLDTHREDGALGAGSCRHLQGWTDEEPGQLGKTSSACQDAKSDAALAHTGSSLNAALCTSGTHIGMEIGPQNSREHRAGP